VTRLTGSAPLAVGFDATGTVATTTTVPFHELEYRWSFGDPTSGNWAFGSRSGSSPRNQATGPLAAHVFETPGVYNVCVTITDGTNTSEGQATITVTDPNTDFMASTLCVDNGATPVAGAEGCPAGADGADDGNFTNVINVRANNGAAYKRILFRAGKTFAATGVARIDENGPGHVGAYGAGARPIISGDTTMLSLGNIANLAFSDWRIADLEFDGLNQTSLSIGISGGGPGSRITILRSLFRNFGSSMINGFITLDNVNAGATNAPIWPEWAIVDSVFRDNRDGGFLMALTASAFMGNQVTNIANGHAVRVIYTRKLVISNNEISHAAATAPLAVLTIRGVAMNPADRPGGTPNQFTLPANSFAEEIVISDNLLTAGTSLLPFSLHASDNSLDVRFRNIIIERNHAVGGPNHNNFLNSEAGLLTIRNNLWNLNTASVSAHIAIGLQGNGGPAGDYITAYNNSLFNGTGDALPVIVLSANPGNPVTNVVARNNLAFAPGNTSGATVAVRDLSGGPGIAQSNNSTTAQIQNGPNPFSVTTPPTQPAHWQPQAGSYAIGSGAPQGQPAVTPGSAPVFSDVFTNCVPDCASPRTGNHMGAVNP